MADEDTARLCVQIIHTHFGPLTSVSAPFAFTKEDGNDDFNRKWPRLFLPVVDYHSRISSDSAL